MDEHDVLQHLLNLEAQAADLVNDAQAESERRISEGEHHNSARYEEVYAREVQTLEESYAKNLIAVKEGYREQLELYRESLSVMPIDMGAFSSLAEEYLFADGPPSKKS